MAAYARSGGRPYVAAKAAGVPYSTSERWFREAKAGVEPLASALAMANEIAVLALEDMLGGYRGEGGSVGLSATLRSLEATDPAKWSPKHQGVTINLDTHKRIVMDEPRTLDMAPKLSERGAEGTGDEQG